MASGMTGDDLFAQILMLRTADSRTVVLLEGGSDCKALDVHIDETMAVTLPGGSKSAVVAAIELVDSQSVARVLGILDRDWVGLIYDPMASPNVVYTDRYDLHATILLVDDVMPRIVTAITDRGKVQEHLGDAKMSSGDVAVRIAGVVGLGRFVACRDDLGVYFRHFPVHEAVAPSGTEIDIAQMVAIALGRSREPGIDGGTFTSSIRTLLDSQPDLVS